MSVVEFATAFADIITRTPLAEGRPLRWTLIANPKAGGFTMRKRWATHRREIDALAAQAREKPLRSGGAAPSRTAGDFDFGDGSHGALGLVTTNSRGHAGDIIAKLIDEMEGEAAGARTTKGGALPFHLVVTAGGDGTSLEAQETLLGASEAVRSRLAVLRLPLGTGNDGSDGRELSESLSLLVEPVRVVRQRAVRLTTATPGLGPFHAFNILSVGLDAFVTHMTNKMKIAMPGDSYKLWVDLAALFYDRFYKVGAMAVTAFDAAGQKVNSFVDRLLLLAMGVSGHRCYGSAKPILPTDDNVCAVSNIPILRRVALKSLFTTGRHADRPEARLFSAEKITIQYDHPLLAQMDGEAVELSPADFPISIALTEPVIPILRKLS